MSSQQSRLLANDHVQTEKKVSLSEMEAHNTRRHFSKPIHAKEERNGPPSANQSLSTAKPRSSQLFTPIGCTRPPPPVLPFLLAQTLSPKDIAGSDITSANLPTSIEVISG